MKYKAKVLGWFPTAQPVVTDRWSDGAPRRVVIIAGKTKLALGGRIRDQGYTTAWRDAWRWSLRVRNVLQHFRRGHQADPRIWRLPDDDAALSMLYALTDWGYLEAEPTGMAVWRITPAGLLWLGVEG